MDIFLDEELEEEDESKSYENNLEYEEEKV
jgi:hypothetical protein